MTLFAMVSSSAGRFPGVLCSRHLQALALGVTLGGMVLALTSDPAPAAPGTILGQEAENGTVGHGVAPDGAEAKKQRFAEGVVAYDAGDYARAYAIWLPLAQGGDLAAQRNVGHLLRHGRGVTRDLLRARDFYEQAGSHGLIGAQLNAAFMYLNGEAAEADPAAAAFWFHKAAAAGASIAEYNLALMYDSGRGVDRDMPRALGWYARAAQNGHELALKRLSELVAELPGPPEPAAELPAAALSENLGPEPPQATPAMPALAAPVAELAATRAKPPASAALSVTRPDETPDGTDHLSRSPIFDASDEADGAGQLVSPRQGSAFMAGKSLYWAGDYYGAAKLWAPLAREGVAEAQYRYGQLLAAGQGVVQDTTAAYTWFSLAAAAGHPSAARAAAGLRPHLSREALETAQQAEATFRATVPN